MRAFSDTEEAIHAAMPKVFALPETVDEPARRELNKLVRKLRWIGKEDEARDWPGK
jgi:hypothetical protein